MSATLPLLQAGRSSRTRLCPEEASAAFAVQLQQLRPEIAEERQNPLHTAHHCTLVVKARTDLDVTDPKSQTLTDALRIWAVRMCRPSIFDPEPCKPWKLRSKPITLVP